MSVVASVKRPARRPVHLQAPQQGQRKPHAVHCDAVLHDRSRLDRDCAAALLSPTYYRPSNPALTHLQLPLATEIPALLPISRTPAMAAAESVQRGRTRARSDVLLPVGECLLDGGEADPFLF